MIRMAKGEDWERLEQLCAGSAFGCRIASTFSAYGTEYPFVQFWFQEQKKQPVAVLCRLDDVMTVQVLPQADITELREMVLAVAPRILCCDKSVAAAMEFSPQKSGKILMCREEFPANQVEVQGETLVSLKDLYHLWEQSEDSLFRPPIFEAFYLDASHRIRHRTADVVGVYEKGLISGAWIIYSKTDAIISSVVVHPHFRGKGLGKKTVFMALNCAFPRRAFVLCDQKKNELFYRSMGFFSCGEWCETML